jgi:hypothetical protein
MNAPATIQNMIAQLGGARIFAMAFTGSMYDGDRKLTLKIAKPLVKHATGKATHVMVELEENDTYTIKAVRAVNSRSKGYSVDDIKSVSMVYGDQLRTVVEGMIGLQLTLGTMGRAS